MDEPYVSRKVLPPNGKVCDDAGIPWRATTRKGSPYYVSREEFRRLTLTLNGQWFLEAGIIAWDRVEGWLLVQNWDGGTPYKVHGKVEVFHD